MFRLQPVLFVVVALSWLASRLVGVASAQGSGGFVDVVDGRYTFESRCAGCHGSDPLNILRGPSFSELWGRSLGELNHGGGQLPYLGVNLTNLAAYFSSIDTNGYRLSAVVMDSDGRGMEGVEVTVASDSIGYEPRSAISAPDGGVRFDGMPAGDHTLVCRSAEWQFDPPKFETRTIRAANSSSGLFIAYRPGTSPPASAPVPSIIRVHPQGDDQGNGRAWAAAVRTISAALLLAPPEAQIWIASGTYREVLDVHGQQLFGGFAGGETRLEERDWIRNPVVVDADPAALNELGILASSVITLSSDPGVTARCDGLHLVNGVADFGGGIRVNSGSSAVVDHCSIIGNHSTYSGGGVFCDQLALLKVSHSVLKGNSSELGGAVHCSFDSVVELTEDLMVANHASTASALYADGYVAWMLNNTIVQNASDDGSGTIVQWDGSGTNMNNIIAFNSGGIDSFGTPDGWNHNAVFGNTNFDWVNLSPGSTDIVSDPGFRDPVLGDFRLRPDSSCIDGGSDGLPLVELTDLASAPRLSRRQIDLGAYELPPPSLTVECGASEIRLRWPGDETGFELESAPDANASHWTPVGSPRRDGDQWLVTVPKPAGNEFFRLHQ